MHLDRYVLVILFVGYCRGYSSNIKYYRQKRYETLNEGDACDKVDGVTWTCEDTVNCAVEFYKTPASEIKYCDADELLSCCPSRGSTSSSNNFSFQPFLPKRTYTTSETTTDTTTSTTTTTPLQLKELRLSEKKCLEYTRRAPCAIDEKPLIIGGTKAGPKEFPHQALIGYGTEDDPNWWCGGSLISDYFILTAQHCLVIRQEKATLVLLGETNIEEGEYFKSSIVPLEPKSYYPRYLRDKVHKDIGLLKTTKQVVFNAYVKPACLDTSDSPFISMKSKDLLLATGWGIADKGERSEELLKVEIDVIEKDECSPYFEYAFKGLPFGIDNDTQICAGNLQKRKGTCKGDSGGPLQALLRDPKCMYTIVGVTSKGVINGCGTFKPSLFTRVSYFVPWIESIVWPNS